MIPFSLVQTADNAFITVFVPGRDPLPAQASHPNFDAIVAACEAARRGEDVSAEDVADLFDVAATVERKFARLSERVTVDAEGIKLDGDPVHGTLQEQILDFLDAGEDFGPLVKFYEKLTTNPLGDVRDGLYDWIKGQTANGRKLSISAEGNILGYKSVRSQAPSWRKDVGDTVYVPSRVGPGVVNGVDTPPGAYIEQVPGDIVEMPRSKVLHAPSQACGDGLHIGTYEYASRGQQGDTVLLVEFSPRDIVSLPDCNSSWKLRVCRYTVIGPVDEPLAVPVYLTASSEPEASEPEASEPEPAVQVGTRLVDWMGDKATVTSVKDGKVVVQWDDPQYGDGGTQTVDFYAIGPAGYDFDNGYELYFFAVLPDEQDDIEFAAGGDFQVGDRVEDEDGDQGIVVSVTPDGDHVEVEFDDEQYGKLHMPSATTTNLTRKHGKGGRTSYAAKGRGRNPAQDEKGKFSAGRPGSVRDKSTGRFA